MSRSKFNEFRSKRLQDAAVRAAYEDARTRKLVLDQLVQCRRDQKITQTELARIIDVGQSTISGFETEGSDPRLSTLLRYARAVKASLFLTVVPHIEGSARPNVYVCLPGGAPTRVRHSEVTPRAKEWVDSEPYVEPQRVTPQRATLSLVS